MKKYPLILLVIVSLVWLMVSCEKKPATKPELPVKNDFANPSFESGSGDVVDLWRPMPFRGSVEPSFSWKSDPERNGKIIGVTLSKIGGGGWLQTVNLEPDGLYRYSGWIKTQDIDGKGAGASLVFPQFRWMPPLSIQKANEWKLLEGEILNAGMTRLDFLCTLGAMGGNSGSVWFDDLTLTRLPNPALDSDQVRPLEWNTFKLRYDTKRGTVTSIKPGTTYVDTPEFLASYPTLPFLDPRKAHFLGDISMEIQAASQWQTVTTADESMSPAVKQVSDTELMVVNKPKDAQTAPRITSRWKMESESLIWSIELENTGSADMIIGAIDLPLPWNNNYCLFDPHDKASQKLLYTRRVAEHKLISGPSSYVLACPMDGKPPMLILTPANTDTQFEFAYHDVESIRNQRRDSGRWIHGAWPGLSRICLLSQGIMEKNNWTPWLNPHSSLTLKSGQTKTYAIRFDWLHHRKDLEEHLAQTGQLGIRVIPGPSVPVGTDVLVYVFGAQEPLTVTGVSEWETVTPGAPFEGVIIRFRLEEEGFPTIRITDAKKRTGSVFMAALASLDQLMERRSRFIMEKQVYHKTGDPLDQAVLCYDNRAKQVLAVPDDMWGSGGYEGGITDAQFMALKNLDLPNPDQITYLENYIEKWVIGGIQDPTDYGVCWMVSAKERKERGYNYIHVLNLYDAMARASAVWPELFRKKTSHYLDLWLRTFTAFRKESVRFQDLGLMGRGNICFMPEFLRRYEMNEQAETVEEEIRKWADYWMEDPPFPYGSELFFDNTGYETVFMYCDYAGHRDLAQQTVDVTKAGRGREPCWFWNDSDQRWWDAVRTAPQYDSFTDFGENCHHYMTGLNGAMLLEAYDRGYGRSEPAPIGFSGILNSWARVTPDGFAGMCYCPDPASDNYGLNQFTGDVGLGLWGCLKAARCYAIQDQRFGIQVYGGVLRESTPQTDADTLTVEPLPGLDHRVRFVSPDLFIDSEGPSIVSAAWSPNENSVQVTLRNKSSHRCQGVISVKGLPVNQYRCIWKDGNTGNEIRSGTISVDESAYRDKEPFAPGAAMTLIIRSTANG